MVSGSKLKNPSKVSGDSPISLYYSLIYGNCLGNVVMGMEKCGKMCKNVAKCAGDPFSIYYSPIKVFKYKIKYANTKFKFINIKTKLINFILHQITD